jgi:hypothetical protein
LSSTREPTQDPSSGGVGPRQELRRRSWAAYGEDVDPAPGELEEGSGGEGPRRVGHRSGPGRV